MSLITKYNRLPFRVVITVPHHGWMVGRGRSFEDARAEAVRKLAEATARNAAAALALTEALAELDPLDHPIEIPSYGDTGVTRSGCGYMYDAESDLEGRGIDATANPDLVAAWAHALEVADVDS